LICVQQSHATQISILVSDKKNSCLRNNLLRY
jgi:hypothetical protein